MTIAIAVAAANTSTGNQDFTTTDMGGATPKGVIFLYSRSPADGTITADSGASFGAADGTNQWACANYIKDDLSDTLNDVGVSDKCLFALLNATTTHSEAAFVSFIANGVRVNWTTATTDGWLVTAILFSGAAVSFAAGKVNAQDGTAVNVGFEPDIVLFAGSGRSLGRDTSLGSRGRIGFGGNAWPGGNRKGAFGSRWSWTPTRQRVSWLSGGVSQTAMALFDPFLGVSVIADRTATGFAVDSFLGATSAEWGYVAFKANSGTCGCLQLTAATGDQTVTGLGFEPELILLFGGETVTNDAAEFTGSNAFAAATALKTGGFATCSQNGGGVDKSTAFEDKVRILAPGGTENCRFTVSDIFDGGFTLNFTDAPNGAWQMPYIAFGPTGGGGGGSVPARVQAWITD